MRRQVVCGWCSQCMVLSIFLASSGGSHRPEAYGCVGGVFVLVTCDYNLRFPNRSRLDNTLFQFETLSTLNRSARAVQDLLL